MKLTTGQKIKIIRATKEMQQKELAEKAGVAVTTVSMIEVGRNNGSFYVICKIADALGVSVDSLRPDE